MLEQSAGERVALHNHIRYFKEHITNKAALIPSDSAIQCLLLKSNERAKVLSGILQTSGLDVRPIFSPTVAAGAERVRICIHAYQTTAELNQLTTLINEFLK